ncbi:hypothetical protein L6R52_02810 [Myxococcota bacterium]|nr:hypothetical protein [Myxococcota bacterium]
MARALLEEADETSRTRAGFDLVSCFGGALVAEWRRGNVGSGPGLDIPAQIPDLGPEHGC